MATDAFAGIRGQDEAVEVLRRAVAGGRVAHAYAFVGPAGSGRKATALAFAKALVAPGDAGRAGRIDRGTCPDVRLIAPTPPEKNPKGPLALRIEDIRELERLAALRPAEARVEGLHRRRRGPDDGRGAAGNLEDAGGAARPHRDRPRSFRSCARCPRPCSPAARSFGSARGLVEGARALLPDGRERALCRRAVRARGKPRGWRGRHPPRGRSARPRPRGGGDAGGGVLAPLSRPPLSRGRRRPAIGRLRDAAGTRSRAGSTSCSADSGPAGRRGRRSRAMSPRA